MRTIESDMSGLLAEFTSVDLGDARRNGRLIEIAKAFAAAPGSSFPEMMRTAAELEAFYRFVNNEQFTFEDVARAHWRASGARIDAEGAAVLVVHDATDYSFPFDEDLREGCERLGRKLQGFFGSVSISLAAECFAQLVNPSCTIR